MGPGEGDRSSAARWGLAGGVVAGTLDVARVALFDRLDPGLAALAADVVVGLVPAALLGLVAGALLRRSRRAAFGAGVGAVLVATVLGGVLLPATPYGATLPDLSRHTLGSPGPNVLLVTLDAARADRFEDPRVTTTATNRVAVEGVRFRSAWAQVPYTGPSYAALHTGTAPWDSGVWLDGVPLAEQIPTLAEVLAATGRDTGAFLSRGTMARGLGFERGFRVYDDDLAWAKGAERLPAGRLWVLFQRGRHGWLQDRQYGATVDRALRWLDRRRAPWFAWVQIGDGEPPFTPPPPYDTRYVPETGPVDPRSGHLPHGVPDAIARHHDGVTDTDWLVGLYDGEVAAADREVARLLDWLDAKGIADETLVVVTAPNGMALGEDGRWFRHDGLGDDELRVPWVARWPGHLPARVAIDDPVEVGDVAPTVLAWVGVAAPAAWTGASAADLATGGPAPRGVARSVAFEPGGDGYRIAVVRSRTDRWLHFERPGAVDQGPVSDDPEQGLLADLLSERARDLLHGWDPTTVRQPDLSAAARWWLDGQGAKTSAPPPSEGAHGHW